MHLDTQLIDDLIRQAKAGSVVALDQLITSSLPRIEYWSNAQARYFHRLRLSCRDLTQEVVYIAQRYFHQFHGETTASWLAWLKRIHFRMIQAMVKDKKSTSSIHIDEAQTTDNSGIDSNSLVSRETTPGSMAALREQSDRVKSVMKQMDKQLEQALIHWLDGVSLEQHATLLDTKIHNIRYLRFKALKEFHALWKTSKLKD
jgi:RNA polymerase sigma factor (sigma-70 family)